tara:strand:+ start:4477 stop:4935 length:459 start_codon:yes stop_codon:yes gene_type:complete
MEIENLLDLESKIIANRVVFKFTFKEIPITELRMLKTIEMLTDVLDSFKKPEIKHVCFVFVINKMKMPSNLGLFKDFARTFNDYSVVINEKLDFTIIQSNNGIFKMFFSLFKMYYEPIKPLYICESDESTEKCLTSNNERNKVKNFSDMIKN